MKILICAGDKSNNLLDALGKKFSDGSIEFDKECYVSDINDYLNKGGSFNRIVVTAQAIDKDGTFASNIEYQMFIIATLVEILKERQPKSDLVFLLGDNNELADIAYNECYSLGDRVRVLHLTKDVKVTVNLLVKVCVLPFDKMDVDIINTYIYKGTDVSSNISATVGTDNNFTNMVRVGDLDEESNEFDTTEPDYQDTDNYSEFDEGGLEEDFDNTNDFEEDDFNNGDFESDDSIETDELEEDFYETEEIEVDEDESIDESLSEDYEHNFDEDTDGIETDYESDFDTDSFDTSDIEDEADYESDFDTEGFDTEGFDKSDTENFDGDSFDTSDIEVDDFDSNGFDTEDFDEDSSDTEDFDTNSDIEVADGEFDSSDGDTDFANGDFDSSDGDINNFDIEDDSNGVNSDLAEDDSDTFESENDLANDLFDIEDTDDSEIDETDKLFETEPDEAEPENEEIETEDVINNISDNNSNTSEVPKRKGLFGRAKESKASNSATAFNKTDLTELRKILDSYSRRGHCMLVSGTSNSGTTTLAGNIANVVAGLGYNVAIVDFDLSKRGQTYLSRDAFMAVNSDSNYTDTLMKVINNRNSNISANSAIVKTGLNLFGTSVEEDTPNIEKIVKSQNDLRDFIYNLKTIYNFIVIDSPMHYLDKYLSELVICSDSIVLTVEPTNKSLLEFTMNLVNIEEYKVSRDIFSRAKIVASKVSGSTDKILGKKCNNYNSMLRLLDQHIYDVTGNETGGMFSNLRVSGVIPSIVNLDSYIYNKGYFSDTKLGKEMYLSVLSAIMIG